MFKKILLLPVAPVYFTIYNLRYRLEQTALLSAILSVATIVVLKAMHPAAYVLVPLYVAWGIALIKYGGVPRTGTRDAVAYKRKVSKLRLKPPLYNLSVSIFQTGRIETGSWGVYEGPSRPIVMDQPVFLVHHPKGLITFEAGIHPEVSKNPAGYVGPVLFYGGFLQMKQEPGQDVLSQLKKRKINPTKIKAMYISHLHPEHGGAAALFPNAKIAVDKKEHSYAMNKPKYNYFKREYEQIQNWQLLDFSRAKKFHPFNGAIDVFDDGSVLVVSTPGHTPGSISMLVNLPEGPVFLVGDIAWNLMNIETGTIGIPFVSVDALAHRKALGKLMAFIKANPKVTIVPTHDLSSLNNRPRKDVLLVD